MASASLWVGEMCMGFAVIAFTLMGLRARAGDKHHYLVSILIVMIATASYFAMSIGQTHLTLSDGHGIFIARYLDWALTTPLLILGTATIGIRSLGSDKTHVYGAIAADIFMILTGFAGGLSVDNSRWVWYAFSCIAFVAVLLLLWGPLRAQATLAGRGAIYRRLILVLTVLWIQYPFVWLLGGEGFRVLPSGPETLWYSALDVIAKVVFGFLSLAAVKSLDPAVEEPAPLRGSSPPLTTNSPR